MTNKNVFNWEDQVHHHRQHQHVTTMQYGSISRVQDYCKNMLPQSKALIYSVRVPVSQKCCRKLAWTVNFVTLKSQQDDKLQFLSWKIRQSSSITVVRQCFSLLTKKTGFAKQTALLWRNAQLLFKTCFMFMKTLKKMHHKWMVPYYMNSSVCDNIIAL